MRNLDEDDITRAVLAMHAGAAGDRCLASDAFFGVPSLLVADGVEHPAGAMPDGTPGAVPFHTLDFDFVLNPASDAGRRGAARRPGWGGVRALQEPPLLTIPQYSIAGRRLDRHQ